MMHSPVTSPLRVASASIASSSSTFSFSVFLERASMASVKVRGLPFGWFTVLPVSSTFGDEVGKSMALEIQK